MKGKQRKRERERGEGGRERERESEREGGEKGALNDNLCICYLELCRISTVETGKAGNVCVT
jgi:hypothetical protein